MAFPKKLNIGSGKDFREDFLNLDIDDTWYPDIVFDLSLPLLKNNGAFFSTKRFGDIKVTANCFEYILAYDVLEHIRDLTTAMTSCLQILETGGIFEILVPYDLSYGAWQDPTHVRAFNDRSWLYYTDWFWYLGWTESRFTVDKSEYILSDFGKKLVANGMQTEEISRTPRAIDSMRVRLKKIVLSVEDKRALNEFRKGSKFGQYTL